MQFTGFPTIYWSVPMIFWCVPTIFWSYPIDFWFVPIINWYFSDWISIQLDQKILGNGQKIVRTHKKNGILPKIYKNQTINRGKPCISNEILSFVRLTELCQELNHDKRINIPRGPAKVSRQLLSWIMSELNNAHCWAIVLIITKIGKSNSYNRPFFLLRS